MTRKFSSKKLYLEILFLLFAIFIWARSLFIPTSPIIIIGIVLLGFIFEFYGDEIDEELRRIYKSKKILEVIIALLIFFIVTALGEYILKERYVQVGGIINRAFIVIILPIVERLHYLIFKWRYLYLK
ncbi:MAG: hypothetical protein Q4Q07_08185 [Tissierellia bacterium]|nr:hypothetical protein [Tissierellia bacterium]